MNKLADRSNCSGGLDGTSSLSASIIHLMSYSPCGNTIATSGDNCTVRIWDARGLANYTTNPDYALTQSWGTNGYVGDFSSTPYFPNKAPPHSHHLPRAVHCLTIRRKRMC